MRQIIFNNVECVVSRTSFSNEVACLVLADAGDYQPTARASINLPCYDIGENQTFIKNIRENEGMLEALISGNIVKLPSTELIDVEGILVDIIEPGLMI